MSINFKYDYVGNFSEGLAYVRRNGKYGYIDTTGRKVIPCSREYKFVNLFDFYAPASTDFHEGLACVIKEDKWGYIDKTGREVIPCIYDDASVFSDGLAKVSFEGKRFYIDRTGKEVLTAGKDWDVFKEGLARITKDGKTGFVDKVGNEVIPCKYDGASMFCEGMASVCQDHPLPEDEETDEIDYYTTLGYIDKTGREVTPCKYEAANDFHEGLALVALEGKCGFIDKSGVEVIPLQYDYAHDFQDGLAQVAIGDESFFIDKSGKKVFSFAEQGILAAWDFSEGLAVACFEPGGKRGYIDKTGKQVIPGNYFEAHDFHDGLARVSDGHGKMYFIDKTGTELEISESVTETTVFVAGSRESIIRILNRAFRMSSRQDFKIADNDSLEAINGKIRAANEHISGLLSGFTLVDYLDDRSRMDCPFKDVILGYIDEVEPDGSENYDANPMEVAQEDGVYVLKISSFVNDGQDTYTPEDWRYWCGMISAYDNCLIRFKKG
ncbi:MAG: WG repeat-containing protein [Bacteroidales bacterium]|nr:WG repeat-containing protein [Bacteroidales bacterium]